LWPSRKRHDGSIGVFNALPRFVSVQGSQPLFKLLVVVGAVGFVDYLIVALLFYRLFIPVSKTAAGLMLAFVVISAFRASLAGGPDKLLLPQCFTTYIE
jgi:hypothetical protein